MGKFYNIKTCFNLMINDKIDGIIYLIPTTPRNTAILGLCMMKKIETVKQALQTMYFTTKY